MRFALLELKVAIAALVMTYELLPCDKTPKHIEFNPKTTTPALEVEGGVFIKFKRFCKT